MLCFALAMYGFGVFGCVTMALATYFVGRDAEEKDGEIAGQKSLEAIRAEVTALRDEIRALRAESRSSS